MASQSLYTTFSRTYPNPSVAMPCKNPDSESHAWKDVLHSEITALADVDTIQLDTPPTERALLLDTPGCTLSPGSTNIRLKADVVDQATLEALLHCDNDPESECTNAIIQTIQDWEYFKAFFNGDLHYFEPTANPVTILTDVLDKTAFTS